MVSSEKLLNYPEAVPVKTSPLCPASLLAFEDGISFMTFAMQSLSQDEFTKCFEPKSTSFTLDYYSQSFFHFFFYPFYLIGLCIRYGVLLPIRLSFLVLSMIVFLIILPFAIHFGSPDIIRNLYLFINKVWAMSIFAYIRHHGRKPLLNGEPHLFVANHTSYLDLIIMSSHCTPHATVAQVHGGLIGMLLKYLLQPIGGLTFQRNEKRDRLSLARKLKEHVKNTTMAALVIFPEGTCVNNEYTVLFHKGAFELGVKICPTAIKYNKKLLDPYWNTREQTFSQYWFYLMTRWLMIVDVYWMEPQMIKEGESAIEFANRVKAQISNIAGLQNLSWDGYMKNFMAAKEQVKLVKNSQQQYVTQLKKKLSLISGESLDRQMEAEAKNKDMGNLTTMAKNDTLVSVKEPLAAIDDSINNSKNNINNNKSNDDDNDLEVAHSVRPLSISSISDVSDIPSMLASDYKSPVSVVPRLSPRSKRAQSETLSRAQLPLPLHSTHASPVETHSAINLTSVEEDPLLLNFPQWLPDHAVVDIKNELLKNLFPSESISDSLAFSTATSRFNTMMQSLAEAKEDVIHTWKTFTKVKNSDTTSRRIENSSWRIWFRQKKQEQAASVPNSTVTSPAVSPVLLPDSSSASHQNEIDPIH